jgi:hypothetical protein
MAIALEYAEDPSNGRMPKDYRMFKYIQQFGVEAVMGRPWLGAKEINRMLITANIIQAYKSREGSDNWAEWSRKNPELSNLLNYVIQVADNG